MSAMPAESFAPPVGQPDTSSRRAQLECDRGLAADSWQN
jgi:hypothetical protein